MADEKTPDTSTETTDEATPSTGLHVYKPERELHYESEVGQMIDYEATIPDPDIERPAWTIIVPEKEVAKHKRWFNESAKDRKRTVRAVSTKPHGDGFAAVEFVLRAEKPTKPEKETSETTSAATSDATPEVSEPAADTKAA